MYTIFINDSVIYLSDRPHKSTDIRSIQYKNQNFNEIVEILLENEATKTCFYHHNLKELWQEFQNQFKVIAAAGGLVFNEKNETLWIFRNGVWDLPKGKIDDGETKEIAAIREVKEECGIENVQRKELLITTYHMYSYKKNTVLKVTYWYKMVSNSNERLIPQLEEGITEIAWFSDVKLNEIFENTYDNIKLICKFAL